MFTKKYNFIVSRFEKMNDDDNEFLEYIKSNLTEVDLTLAVFALAVSNYKYESLVKPFPPMYVLSNGNKDITSLVRLNARNCCSNCFYVEK